MDYLIEIKKKFAQKGYRSAPARDALLHIFFKSKKPLSASLLLASLKKQRILVNKTTVYRELAVLEKEGVIEKVEMGDNQRWYESSHLQHHHHAICERCDRVEDLDIPEKTKLEIERLVTEKGFAPRRHTIEFFGLCKQCQR